jgi:rhamnogalacturonan endolyase
VVVVDSGGATDRVSDLNIFWMALDSAGKAPSGRNGKFPSYDGLRLYYAGIGGNENTTTRFRKYDPAKGKPVIQEYLDKNHLLEGNKSYSIRITVQNGRTTLHVNGTRFFDYADKHPLTKGYFAFRTTRSHQRITNFRVEQL